MNMTPQYFTVKKIQSDLAYTRNFFVDISNIKKKTSTWHNCTQKHLLM